MLDVLLEVAGALALCVVLTVVSVLYLATEEWWLGRHAKPGQALEAGYPETPRMEA